MATAQTSAGSVEALRHLVSSLVAERDRLRSHDGTAAELNANLEAIVAIRSRLARSLAASGSDTENPPSTC